MTTPGGVTGTTPGAVVPYILITGSNIWNTTPDPTEPKKEIEKKSDSGTLINENINSDPAENEVLIEEVVLDPQISTGASISINEDGAKSTKKNR